MNNSEPKQMELFKAQTTWFHVFKDMVDNGDLARLSGSSIKVYLVIKSYTNFSSGKSFPMIETIAEKSGISSAQVKRELKSLEEYGYITKSKIGRNNCYTLREKVVIHDAMGQETAVATWDYLPSTVKDAVADLKNVLVTRNLENAQIVHIDKLQVNVTHVYDNGVNLNIQSMMSDLDGLPKDLREKLLSAWSASQNRKKEQ